MATRAQKKYEAILGRASDEAFELLRAEAQKVLDSTNRYESFGASMGAACFYGHDGHGVYDEKLTARARRVVNLAMDITQNFGSPGFFLKPNGRK